MANDKPVSQVGGETQNQSFGDERIRCPYCGEWIMKQAIICRFCGRDLTGSEADSGLPEQRKVQRKTRIKRWIIFLAIGFVCAACPAFLEISSYNEQQFTDALQFRAWYQNLKFHFIINWLFWSLIPAGIAAIWRAIFIRSKK